MRVGIFEEERCTRQSYLVNPVASNIDIKIVSLLLCTSDYWLLKVGKFSLFTLGQQGVPISRHEQVMVIIEVGR